MNPQQDTSSTFTDTWNEFHRGFQPAGHLLRGAGKENWVRFHSLPRSKQFAKTDAEHAIVLERMNVLATEVLGEGQVCWVVQNDVNLADGHPEHGIYQGRVKSLDLQFQGSYHPWDMDCEDQLDAVWSIYAASKPWHAGSFDTELREIAAEVVPLGLWMSAATGAVFAPYPGGADIFLPSQVAVRKMIARHPDWGPHEYKGV